MRTYVLTGGIASGKSTVSKFFVEHGAHLIDCDRIAHRLEEPGTEVFHDIVNRFGSGIVASDGTLDRQTLAHIVFNDEEALHDLNTIIHPRIKEQVERELLGYAISDSNGIVILDVPVFNPADDSWRYDGVIVVVADEEIRINRMMHFRGMSRKEAESRIAAQRSDDEVMASADIVITNNSTQVELFMELEKMWNDFLLTAQS